MDKVAKSADFAVPTPILEWLHEMALATDRQPEIWDQLKCVYTPNFSCFEQLMGQYAKDPTETQKIMDANLYDRKQIHIRELTEHAERAEQELAAFNTLQRLKRANLEGMAARRRWEVDYYQSKISLVGPSGQPMTNLSMRMIESLMSHSVTLKEPEQAPVELQQTAPTLEPSASVEAAADFAVEPQLPEPADQQIACDLLLPPPLIRQVAYSRRC